MANDPAPAADIYNAFHKLVSRAANPFSPVVLTLPMVKQAMDTTLFESVEIRGVRTFDSNLRDRLMKRMQSIAEQLRRRMGLFRLLGLLEPPILARERSSLVDFVTEALQAIGPIVEAEMTMGGEDFAFYTQKIPGAFLQLGIRNEEKHRFPTSSPQV